MIQPEPSEPFPAALRELAEQFCRAAAGTPDIRLLLVLIHTDPQHGGLVAQPGPEPAEVAWRLIPGRSATLAVYSAVEGDTCGCSDCTARRARERVQA